MIEMFWQALQCKSGPPRLLECGTKRQGERCVTMKAEFLSRFPGGVHVGLDAEAGADVDVVADLHDLSGLAYVWTPGSGFDGVLCCSTLEHVKKPWKVAAELARATKPGGVLYVATHFQFPWHSYGGDYFRFSKEALAVLFCEEVGWHLIASGYEFPAVVVPLTNAFVHGAAGWNFEAPSWLGVWAVARRI